MTFNWQKEAQVQWDDRAGFWNENSEAMWDSGSRKDIIPFVEKHLKKGSNMYDIGCGDGYGTSKLHKSGFDVTGVDLSREMIALAKSRYPNKEVQFSQGDVSNLPLDNESADAVMCINVLEWTEEPAKALNELQRILKTSGYLFIGILGPTAGPRANSYPRLHGENTICNTMMPWEFQQLAMEHNWKYIDGLGVYKDGVKGEHHQGLSLELKQALSFMWVFCLEKG